MREPEDRGDYLQAFLSRRNAAVRYAGRRLRTGGSKSRGENTTYPQSPTSELHETAGYPDWVTHQLPRDETDRTACIALSFPARTDELRSSTRENGGNRDANANLCLLLFKITASSSSRRTEIQVSIAPKAT